jgi:hypothetical protein
MQNEVNDDAMMLVNAKSTRCQIPVNSDKNFVKVSALIVVLVAITSTFPPSLLKAEDDFPVPWE